MMDDMNADERIAMGKEFWYMLYQFDDIAFQIRETSPCLAFSEAATHFLTQNRSMDSMTIEEINIWAKGVNVLTTDEKEVWGW